MNNRQRLILLISNIITVSLAVAGLSIYILYRVILQQKQEYLTEVVKSQVHLINALTHNNKNRQVLLNTLIESHKDFRWFGETGEFAIAKRQGDRIIFLLRHQHPKLYQPKPVLWSSNRVEPMKQALSGQSGTIISLDHRGVKVLAAYEPVPNLNWGVIAKIDLAEVQAPFIKAGIYTVIAVTVVDVLAVILILRISYRFPEHKSTNLKNPVSLSLLNAILVFAERNRIFYPALKSCTDTLEKVEDPLLNNDSHLEGVVFTIEDVEDINEREALERKLAHQQQLLDSFIQNAPVGMTALDNQMRYTLINTALAEIHGISVEEHIGKTPWEIIPDLATKQEKVLQQVLTTGEPVPYFEVSGETPKLPGVQRTWLVSYFPIRNQDNQPIGIGIVVVETTEQKATKAALRKTEARFEAFMNHSPLLSWITDSNSRLLYCNKSFEHWCHYRAAEVIGKTIFDFNPPELAQKHFENIQLVLDTKQVLETNESAYLSDGTLGEFLVYKFPLFDTNGQCLVGGIAIDITQNKQAEAALRKSERRSRAIFEQTFQFTAILQPDGTLEDANHSALEFIGLFDKEVIGKPFWEMQWWNTSSEHQHELQAAIQKAASGSLVRYEVEVKGSKERLALIDFSLKPLKDEFGNVTRLIAEGRDITEIKQVQKALQDANTQLNNWVKELETRNREIALLSQLSDILQACLSIEEAHQALALLVEPLFSDLSGAVFVLNHSKDLLEAVAIWGDGDATTELMFEPKDCWGLRRGKAHLAGTDSCSILCQHRKKDNNSHTSMKSLCIPMMAQGQALGVLYLSSERPENLTNTKQQLATTTAEHIAFGLANLQLHEALEKKRIKDENRG